MNYVTLTRNKIICVSNDWVNGLIYKVSPDPDTLYRLHELITSHGNDLLGSLLKILSQLDHIVVDHESVSNGVYGINITVFGKPLVNPKDRVPIFQDEVEDWDYVLEECTYRIIDMFLGGVLAMIGYSRLDHLELVCDYIPGVGLYIREIIKPL